MEIDAVVIGIGECESGDRSSSCLKKEKNVLFFASAHHHKGEFRWNSPFNGLLKLPHIRW